MSGERSHRAPSSGVYGNLEPLNPMAILNQASEGVPDKDQASFNENRVLYSIACRDQKTQLFRTFASSKNPFSNSSPEDLEGLVHPTPYSAIEVVIEASGTWTPQDGTVDSTKLTTFFTQSRNPGYRHRIDNDEGQLLSTPIDCSVEFIQGAIPVSDLGSFRPSLVTIKAIHIHSTNLIAFLRSFIQYYPGQPLSSNKIVLEAPFKMLAHYYRDLVAIKDGKEPISHEVVSQYVGETQVPKAATPASALDAATRYELDILLHSFRGEYMRRFAEEELNHASGVTSFELLWFLFKPGDKFYGRINGKLRGLVFQSCEIMERNHLPPPPRYGHGPGLGPHAAELSRIRSCICNCWYLHFDGKEIVRVPYSFDIEEFTGDREITSLPLFPSVYIDSADGGETRTKLQKLGEKYFNIARVSFGHMGYSGAGWNVDLTVPNFMPAWEPDTVSHVLASKSVCLMNK